LHPAGLAVYGRRGEIDKILKGLPLHRRQATHSRSRSTIPAQSLKYNTDNSHAQPNGGTVCVLRSLLGHLA
jgi:hypothetical protein